MSEQKRWSCITIQFVNARFIFDNIETSETCSPWQPPPRQQSWKNEGGSRGLLGCPATSASPSEKLEWEIKSDNNSGHKKPGSKPGHDEC